MAGIKNIRISTIVHHDYFGHVLCTEENCDFEDETHACPTLGIALDEAALLSVEHRATVHQDPTIRKEWERKLHYE